MLVGANKCDTTGNIQQMMGDRVAQEVDKWGCKHLMTSQLQQTTKMRRRRPYTYTIYNCKMEIYNQLARANVAGGGWTEIKGKGTSS